MCYGYTQSNQKSIPWNNLQANVAPSTCLDTEIEGKGGRPDLRYISRRSSNSHCFVASSNMSL